MGLIFGENQTANKFSDNKAFDGIVAYEEHYMKLLKKYSPEIQAIEQMMQNLREERKKFYLEELPKIEQTMIEDDILSDENKKEWLRQLQENMERSFQISEALIQHYVTKNLEEFERELKVVTYGG